MDRGAWWGIVHGVTKSRTWLSVHAHGALTNRYVGEVESISRAVFISYMDFEANPSIRWAKRFEHTGPGWRGKPDATQACRGCYIRPALSLSNNLFPTYHTLNNASIDLLLETWFLSSAYINRLILFQIKSNLWSQTNQDDAHICKPPKPLDKGTLVDMPCVHARSFSRVRLFETPWTVACQAPLSMGFPRQEYWHGLPFPSPRDLPEWGIEPGRQVLDHWATREVHNKI